MARTTTDPKPRTLVVRISDTDAKKLGRMAQQAKVTKGEVVRQLIREAGPRVPLRTKKRP